MKTVLVLLCVICVTLLGDYLIKVESQKPEGLYTLRFWLGAFLYGIPAIGWFHLMRSHSLATVGVFYSASTTILMAALGVLVFKEALGLREIAGVTLAVLSIIVIGS